MSMYIRKMSFGSFSGFLSIQEKICFSYSSLDFEFFSLFLCFFSFFVYDVIVLFWASRFLINKIYYSFLLKKKKKNCTLEYHSMAHDFVLEPQNQWFLLLVDFIFLS